MVLPGDAGEALGEKARGFQPAHRAARRRAEREIERAGLQRPPRRRRVERREHQARPRCARSEPRRELRCEEEARVVRRGDVERLLAERGIEDVTARQHLTDPLQQIAERRGETPRAPGQLETGGGAHEQLVADDLAHPAQREPRERLARCDEVRDSVELAGAEERFDGLHQPRVERLAKRWNAELHVAEPDRRASFSVG